LAQAAKRYQAKWEPVGVRKTRQIKKRQAGTLFKPADFLSEQTF
jgi:hypothetical protein